MTFIVFTPGELCDPFEYFCMSCGQMRLSFIVTDKCLNCGAPITHRGEIGTLDRDRLRAEFADRMSY